MSSVIKSFCNKKGSNPKADNEHSNPLIITNKNQQLNLSDLPLDVKHNLFAKLPYFYGRKDENFDLFIEILESRTDPLNIAENDKLILLKYCLLDKAAEAYIKIAEKTTTLTWMHMINSLKQVLPVEPQITYRILHQRIQQNNETVEDYGQIIQQMTNMLYSNQSGFNQKARNAEMVKVFTNGLQQPLKRQLKQKTYMDFPEALREANRLQLQQQRQQPHSISYERP